MDGVVEGQGGEFVDVDLQGDWRELVPSELEVECMVAVEMRK